MDDYDPYLHRAPVRDIFAAWAIAVALLAVLLALPNYSRTNFADSTEIATKETIAEAIPRDGSGPLR